MRRMAAVLLVAGVISQVLAGMTLSSGSNSTDVTDVPGDVYPASPYVLPWPDHSRGLGYIYDSVTATIPKYLVEDEDYLNCIAVTWWDELQERADVVPDEGMLIWQAGQTATATDPRGDSPITEGDLLSFSVWEPDADHLSLRWRLAVPVDQVPGVVSPYAGLLPPQSAGVQPAAQNTAYTVWLGTAPTEQELYLLMMYDSAATAARVVHPAYAFCDIRRAWMEQHGSQITARVQLQGDVPLPPPQDASGLRYFFAFASSSSPHTQPFSHLMASWNGQWQGEMGKTVDGLLEPLASVPVRVDDSQLCMSASILALGLPTAFAWSTGTMTVIGAAGEEYVAWLDSAPEGEVGYVEMTLEPFPIWTLYLPVLVN